MQEPDGVLGGKRGRRFPVKQGKGNAADQPPLGKKHETNQMLFTSSGEARSEVEDRKRGGNEQQWHSTGYILWARVGKILKQRTLRRGRNQQIGPDKNSK